jgi:hypothetical protein
VVVEPDSSTIAAMRNQIHLLFCMPAGSAGVDGGALAGGAHGGRQQQQQQRSHAHSQQGQQAIKA